VQLEALHRLARALAGGEFRAHTLLSRACVAVAEGFGFERVGIVRYVPASATLIPFVAHGLSAEETAAIPAALPISRFAAFGRALEAQRAIFTTGPREADRVPEQLRRDFGLGSFVIVPLVSEGRYLGFLTCDQRGGDFSLQPSELDLLTTIGTLIAAFLERAIEHGELRRLNELKSQFAAIASHELRTPVAAIYGAVRTFEERGENLSSEHREQLWSILVRQSERLNELVQNLLDLSRLETDSLQIAPVEIDLRRRIQELVEFVCRRPGDVIVQVPPDLSVTADATALDRILSNLLTNAERHGAPPIQITASATPYHLVITVEDHGGGIESEFADSLFDRFTRGRTSFSEGAGLGLSIARAYARAQGGSISHAPVEPHGVAFTVEIPVNSE